MCAPRLLACLGLALLMAGPAGAQTSAETPVNPTEPQELVSLLLPGRLVWGATVLETGEVLAPCEDWDLKVFSPDGQAWGHWRADQRLAGPAQAGAPGVLTPVVQALAGGRFQVLVWDRLTRTLAPTWHADRAAAPGAAAWGPDGTLVTGWDDGRVEARSPVGDLLWAADLGVPVRGLLASNVRAVYVRAPDRLVLLGAGGRPAGSWPLGGDEGGLAQGFGGSLWAWDPRGTLQFDPTAGFSILDPGAGVLGVLVDRQDRILTVRPLEVVRRAADRRVLGRFVPEVPVTGPPALDDRGRLYLPTARGLEEWTYDGRLLAILGEGTPTAGAALGRSGTAAWGTSDWQFHLAGGFRPAAPGWSQDGGSGGRSWTGTTPAPFPQRRKAWTDDPEFSHWSQLIATGKEEAQREVLELLEAEAARGTLEARRPWANLLLLQLARSGVEDLILDDLRLTNTWPDLRRRAYRLLGQTARAEDRDDLLLLAAKEHDPAVAAPAVQALAASGWDGDGKVARALAQTQARFSAEASVADACVEAAKRIWAFNGRSTDPALLEMTSQVFQGPYPRTVKTRAQVFFQTLAGDP